MRGGECANPGEVRFMGLVLCRRHFRQVELEDRRDSLRAMMLLLDALMEDVDGDARERIRLRREDAAARLHVVEDARRELYKSGYG